MTIPDLLTVPATAKALRVCVRTVWAEVNSGALPSTRICGRVLAQARALGEYIQRNTTRQAQSAA